MFDDFPKASKQIKSKQIKFDMSEEFPRAPNSVFIKQCNKQYIKKNTMCMYDPSNKLNWKTNFK